MISTVTPPPLFCVMYPATLPSRETLAPFSLAKAPRGLGIKKSGTMGTTVASYLAPVYQELVTGATETMSGRTKAWQFDRSMWGYCFSA